MPRGLLLLQAIGIDAGQRADQRRLAVIDVARGADDHDASPACGESGSSARRSASSRSSSVQLSRTATKNRSANLLCARCARVEPGERCHRVARNTGADVVGRAQHRLRIGVVEERGLAPPPGSRLGIAPDTQGIVIHEPETAS